MADALRARQGQAADDRVPVVGASRRPSPPVLGAVAAALALPVLFRIDVGFSPGDLPGRRALALAVVAVIMGCHLLPTPWPRRVAGLAAVGGLAALGLHSVSFTLLLSVVLVEATLRHLAGTAADEAATRDTALGLVLVSGVVAIGQRPPTPLPGVALQIAAILLVVVSPSALGRIGQAGIDAGRALQRRRSAATPATSVRPDDGTPATTRWWLYRAFTAVAVLAVLALPAVLRPPSGSEPLADPARQAIAVAVALLLTAAYLTRRPRARWTAYGSAIALLELTGWRSIAVPMALSVLIVEAARPAADSAGATTSDGHRPEGLGVVGALAGLAVVFGLAGRTLAAPAQSILMALGAAVLWVRPDALTRVAGLVRTIAVAIATAILTAISVVVWAVFVLLPWAVERVAGWDPTFARRPPGTRLIPRHVQRTDDRRSWIPSTSLLDNRRAGRAAVRLVGAGVVAALLWFLVATKIGAPFYWSTQGPQATTAAMSDSPWWADAIPAEMAAFERGRANAYTGLRLADVRSEFTNVVDGRRVTWQPPTDPVARVWIFGGSTVFGLGQRDDHTIPSELAKAAWTAGLPVEVVNFGVHGDVHWTEANRLRDARASGLPPPDVVVFYDGWNDLTSHPGAGGDADPHFRGVLDPLLADQRIQGNWFSDLFVPDDFTITPLATEPLSPEQAFERGIEQYRSSAEDTRTLARSSGLTTFLFLQPMLATRDGPVEGEPAPSETMMNAAEELRRDRPDGVIDLTAVFDPVDVPVFWDDGHTNEFGARVVAGEIFRNIEPSLRSAAAR